MVETTTQLKPSDWENESDSPEAIRARIKQTRAHMSEVVDEIQTKLSPERLTQEAKELVKDATIRKVENMANTTMRKADTWRYQVMETVKQNPIPAALIGIGLGWLLIEGSRSSSHYGYESNYNDPYYGNTGRVRYYPQEKSFTAKAQETLSENMSNVQQRAGEMTQNIQHKVGEVADDIQTKTGEMASDLSHRAGEMVGSLQSTASDLSHRAGEAASNLQTKAGELQHKMSEQTDYLSHQAQYRMEQAKQSFQNTLETNPLAVGAVAVAAGAAIGLMLPITQKEDELMGEARDRLFSQAQDKAKETLKKVEDRAGEAYRAVAEEVKTQTQQS